MHHDNWKCPKCRHTQFETGQFAATGGGITKFLNIQNKRFTTLTCSQCSYTEIYRTDTSTLSNVLDFFGN